MIVHDFLDFARYITERDQSTIMILRTVGPDGVTDVEKANQIYSAYHLNLEPLGEGLFDKLLYNEFVFIHFDSEQEAYDFSLENLPMNKKNIDSDYFFFLSRSALLPPSVLYVLIYDFSYELF